MRNHMLNKQLDMKSRCNQRPFSLITKKMMQKSGWCDCIKMNYVKKNDLYTSNTFKVKATAKRGYCYIKFNEFTLEEDIKHVLFSIISA